MASLLALGVPRIFSTRMSPSQAQKESIARPLRPELPSDFASDFDFVFFGFATEFGVCRNKISEELSGSRRARGRLRFAYYFQKFLRFTGLVFFVFVESGFQLVKTLMKTG